MTDGEQGGSATHHQNRGENQQHILEFQKHRIGIHDIVASTRAKFDKTELLLQKHQNDAEQKTYDTACHGNKETLVQENPLE